VQVTSATLSIEDEVLYYLLPLFKFMVSAINLREIREFNPLVKIAQLFPPTTPNEVLPLRNIKVRICLKPSTISIPKWRPSCFEFKPGLTQQLDEEELQEEIFHADHDTNIVVLCLQVKRDEPTKPRCLLDARDRNNTVDSNQTILSSIKELMELVAPYKYWSKINLADGY